MSFQYIFRGSQKCSVITANVSEKPMLKIYKLIEKSNPVQERISDSLLCKWKAYLKFVLFELCFNNIKAIASGRSLPGRGKKSWWWVIQRVTFTTKDNSLYLKQFHHHIYWTLYTAFKVQIVQQLIFPVLLN